MPAPLLSEPPQHLEKDSSLKVLWTCGRFFGPKKAGVGNPNSVTTDSPTAGGNAERAEKPLLPLFGGVVSKSSFLSQKRNTRVARELNCTRILFELHFNCFKSLNQRNIPEKKRKWSYYRNFSLRFVAAPFPSCRDNISSCRSLSWAADLWQKLLSRHIENRCNVMSSFPFDL